MSVSLPTAGNAPESDAARITKALEDARMRREASQLKEKMDPLMSKFRDLIQFRLVGYNAQGERIPWGEDIRHIRNVEKKLVLDPLEVEQEFKAIRTMRSEVGSGKEADRQIDAFIAARTKFGRYGAHSYLNSIKKLYTVRRIGWAILAGITKKDGSFYPLGYNYGLNHMPENDDRFPTLCKDTLMAPDEVKSKMNPAETSVNYRTGISQDIEAHILRELGLNIPEGMDTVSIRREGVGSVMKYLIASIADIRKKKHIVFNIGTMYDPHSEERIRNTPSYQHNTRYFEEDLGYRQPPDTGIWVEGAKGYQRLVGKMRWRARGDQVHDALHKLESETSVLTQRNWSILKLKQIAIDIVEQLNKEEKEFTS